MNYFTHSSPRSWKPNAGSVPADIQPAAQPPGWLVQCNEQSPAMRALAENFCSVPLPFAGQIMELHYVGRLQDPASKLQAATTLYA